MKKVLIAAAAMIAGTASASGDFHQLVSHGNWSVELYTAENGAMSCDLKSQPVDGMVVGIDFWNNDEVSLKIVGDFGDVFTREIDLAFQIDNRGYFSFDKAYVYEGYLIWRQSPSVTIWSKLLDDMAAGQAIYLLDENKQKLPPGWSLFGSRKAIQAWKDCIKTMR